MIKVIHKVVLGIGIPACLFLTWVVYQFFTPPLFIYATQVLNNPIAAGENIEVSISRKKTRQCPSIWTAWLLRNGRQIQLEPRKGSAVGVGDDTIIIYWPTPEDAPSGQYILRSHGVYDCAYRNHLVSQPDGLVVIQ